MNTIRKLNGTNSVMLARITGRPIATEARSLTTSFDLVKKNRERRFRWLGHIIRAGPRSTMYQVLVVQHTMGHSGNVLMDAPPHNCIDELRHIADDRCRWKALARSLN